MKEGIEIIKNWHLITDVLGDYNFHDSVIKRLDLNCDTLTLVVNTWCKWNYDSYYDITFRFEDIVHIDTNFDMGNDYAYKLSVELNRQLEHLVHFTLSGSHFYIEAFKVSVISVEKADSFQHRML